MSNTRPTPMPDSGLARIILRLTRAAAGRPRTTIALWLTLVIGCVAAGATVGTKGLTNSQTGVGESARADSLIAKAHLKRPASESIMIRSADAGSTTAAVRALEAKLHALPEAGLVSGPDSTLSFSKAGGRTALVQVTLRGAPDHAGDHVGAVQRAVRQVAAGHPRVTL
ncbi:MAG TPA: hypothetical protein VGI55_13435, partial [Solirubrobacteraceae bacterium]